mgnify:CR=1 FL=1
MLSSKELKQQAKVSLKGGWLPVKWTRKYNKIFRELFANFVANSSFVFHCLNLGCAWLAYPSDVRNKGHFTHLRDTIITLPLKAVGELVMAFWISSIVDNGHCYSS